MDISYGDKGFMETEIESLAKFCDENGKNNW